MPIGSAIIAILCIALAITCLRVASEPKLWRLWWMDLLGVLDVDTDRDARKSQERQMSLMCHLLFVLFATMSASCAFWTVDGIREVKRDKSVLEREVEMGREEIDVVRRKFGGMR
jgi:hypothetical protein